MMLAVWPCPLEREPLASAYGIHPVALPWKQGLGSPVPGAPSETRTHTWSILSRLPLPIGLWGPAIQSSGC